MALLHAGNSVIDKWLLSGEKKEPKLILEKCMFYEKAFY